MSCLAPSDQWLNLNFFMVPRFRGTNLSSFSWSEKRQARHTHFNPPYLALPVSTSAEVALRAFVNMNTNGKPLSIYDLTVAKVERDAGASLHALQEATATSHVELTRYGDLPWTMLTTLAMLHLPADIGDRLARCALLQRKQDLLLGERGLLHGRLSSSKKDPRSTLL